MKPPLDFAWKSFLSIVDKDKDKGLTTISVEEFINFSGKLRMAISGLTDYLSFGKLFEPDSWWKNEKSCSSSMKGPFFL